MPLDALAVNSELDTDSVCGVDPDETNRRPVLVRLRATQFETTSDLPVKSWMPNAPAPLPAISRPLRLTASAGPARIVMPVLPLVTETPEKPWPWMLIDLLMVSAP